MNDAMRVGDAERDRAAAELGDHYAQARIDGTEYSERLDAAWSARTQADLDALFFDLPPLKADSPGARGARARHDLSARGDRRPERASWRSGVPLVPVLTVLGVLFVLTHFSFFLVLALGAGGFWFYKSRNRSREREAWGGSGQRW